MLINISMCVSVLQRTSQELADDGIVGGRKEVPYRAPQQLVLLLLPQELQRGGGEGGRKGRRPRRHGGLAAPARADIVGAAPAQPGGREEAKQEEAPLCRKETRAATASVTTAAAPIAAAPIAPGLGPPRRPVSPTRASRRRRRAPDDRRPRPGPRRGWRPEGGCSRSYICS